MLNNLVADRLGIWFGAFEAFTLFQTISVLGQVWIHIPPRDRLESDSHVAKHRTSSDISQRQSILQEELLIAYPFAEDFQPTLDLPHLPFGPFFGWMFPLLLKEERDAGITHPISNDFDLLGEQ